tara:strand:+ start:1963 stop:2172 length:210 start_codon:yes stop_codon:yes gene_type:complete
MVKVKNKIKEISKSITVNGVEYKPYKKSKQIFLEHQQEHIEDTDRKHAASLDSWIESEMEWEDEVRRGK